MVAGHRRIGIYVLGRTRLGNWIAGVGGSSVAARNLGVPVSPGQDPALRADRVLRVDPGDDPEHDLLLGRHPARHRIDAITTAVIGGQLLTGGYGLVADGARRSRSMVPPGIVFADINADWYKIAIGTLLLVAVVLNNWIRRGSAGL